MAIELHSLSIPWLNKRGEQVSMGDSKSSPTIGKGKVLLKLTSRKVLALSNVLHMPDIHWNLVLVSLVGKVGVRILFDSDKIVLIRNDVFLGKGYCNQGFFYAKCFRTYQ